MKERRDMASEQPRTVIEGLKTSSSRRSKGAGGPSRGGRICSVLGLQTIAGRSDSLRIMPIAARMLDVAMGITLRCLLPME